MMRRDFIRIGATLLSGVAANTWAQTPARKFRIAFICAGGQPPQAHDIAAWRAALARQGLVEGRGFEFVFARSWHGNGEGRTASIREVIDSRPDLLLTKSTNLTRPVQRATTTIPIVFWNVADPVASGFVKSVAKPGGNVTGVSVHNLTLFPKRLQLIRELMPQARRVALIVDGAFIRDGFPAKFYQEMHETARTLELELIEEDLELLPGGLEDAFRNAARKHVDIALGLGPWPSHLIHEIDFVVQQDRHRVPVLGFVPLRGGPQDGLLVQYGGSYEEMVQSGAEVVAKILRGANPAQTPVRQQTRIELVLNLKVARELGVTIPRGVLRRADRVIE
jgi:putative tryptophan/tyrosine transport system substrate-binding protein